MSKGLTRREFVKGTIVGTAALTFAGSPFIFNLGGRTGEAGRDLALRP